MSAELAQQPQADEEGLVFAPQPITPCPANRPQQIHDIVETVDRYNPENLPLLQLYVEQQLEHDTYDREACFAVLELFQFNQGITDATVVCDILALAIASLPDTDFSLALYLLDPETAKHPMVQQLIKLQQLLEEARFIEFWDFLKSDPVALPEEFRNFGVISGEEDLSDEEKKRRRPTHISPRKCTIERYPMFVEKIRRYVSSVLASAYQSTELSYIAHNLGYLTKEEYETGKKQIATGKITDAQVIKRMGDCEKTLIKFKYTIPAAELALISAESTESLAAISTPAAATTTATTSEESKTPAETVPVWVKQDEKATIDSDPVYASKELDIKIEALKLNNTSQQRLQQLQQETVKMEALARLIATSKLIKA